MKFLNHEQVKKNLDTAATHATWDMHDLAEKARKDDLEAKLLEMLQVCMSKSDINSNDLWVVASPQICSILKPDQAICPLSADPEVPFVGFVDNWLLFYVFSDPKLPKNEALCGVGWQPKSYRSVARLTSLNV